MLSRVHLQVPNDIPESDLNAVADAAHGYVGADLAAVCRVWWRLFIVGVVHNIRPRRKLAWR